MSGPDEVERLIAIISDGIRRKMMRPKCLARPSWKNDSTAQLLRRVTEERYELMVAERDLREWLISAETGRIIPMRLATVPLDDFVQAVADETFDLAAFGGMLIDPERLGG